MNFARKLFLGLLLACSHTVAFAADNEAADESAFQFNAGLKLYLNRLHGEIFAASSGSLIIEPYRTGQEISLIPVVGARYKDFVLSGSYLVPTTYDVSGASGDHAKLERSEVDINLGWQVIPSVTISIGYKRLQTESKTAPFDGQKFTVKGPTIGVALSGSLSDRLGMYTNLAYSRTHSSFVIDIGPVDYLTLESGISYGLLTEPAMGLRGLNAIFGYRYQKAETRNNVRGFYSDPTFSAFVPVNGRLTNVSDGWILGIFGSF